MTEKGEILDSIISECKTYKGYVGSDTSQYIRLFIDETVIRGIINDGNDNFYSIEPLSHFMQSKSKDNRYIIYNLKNITNIGGKCGTSDESTNDIVKEAQKGARISGDAYHPNYRYLEVATDTDYSYRNTSGTSAAATDAILAHLNMVDGIYKDTFNISIIVTYQRVQVDQVNDPYVLYNVPGNRNSSAILTNFRNYWNANMTSVPRDIAYLFVGGDMDLSTLGIAYTGSLCTTSNAYGVTGSLYASGIYLTTAHEIGHIMGARHPGQSSASSPVDTSHPDFNNCGCQPGGYNSIMCSGLTKSPSFCLPSLTQITNYLASNSDCLYHTEWDFKILGRPTLCTTRTYRPSILSSNVTFTSSNTSLLSINSTTGVAIRVGTGNGIVTVTGSFLFCDVPYIASTSVYVGLPNTPTINVTGVAPYGAVDVNTNFIPDVTYNWYRDNVLLQTTTNNYQTLNGGNCGSQHNMTVSLTNNCGETPRSSPYFYSYPCSFMSVYPNPANDILTFEFASDASQVSLPQEIKLYNEQSVSVRTLSSSAIVKNNLKEGNKLFLNVKDLPRGTYYLHVFPTKESGKEKEIIRILLQ